MASPEFYKAGADTIAKTMARAGDVERDLITVYARWDKLDSRS